MLIFTRTCKFLLKLSGASVTMSSRHLSRDFREVKIPVPWGFISGRWWAPYDTRPILAIHGWQDNCGSFNRLIPEMSQKTGVLAIDCPGHGYSSQIPQGFNYFFIDNVIVISRIMEHYKWDKVSLMGHSMGSITAYMYTCIFPDSVDLCVAIDGLSPLHRPDNTQKLSLGIKDLLKYDAFLRSPEEPPSYDLDEIKEKWCAWLRNSIALEHSHHIVERTIAPSRVHPGKYYITRDPRLKARLYLNWPLEDLLQLAAQVTAPLLVIKFNQSGYFGSKKGFLEIGEVLQKTSKDLQMHFIDGSHHTHLNAPETVSGVINEFIEKHHQGEQQMISCKY